jgi:hypothetical protein
MCAVFTSFMKIRPETQALIHKVFDTILLFLSLSILIPFIPLS